MGGLLLDEREGRSTALAHGRGAPVGPDRLPDLLAERIRRDRAVGAQSEEALVEMRREPREELPLTGAPLGRAAHDDVERLGERATEQLRAVEERLDDAQ